MVKTPPLIAVVDDDASVRTALRRLLRAAGFAVETFESGDAFLAAAGSGAPDCLVLDLHMPGLNGFDVQRELAVSHHSIPTIIITGKEEPGTADRARAGGAVAFLTKPFDEAALLTAVTLSLAGADPR
jgi:FixJ family two-component response regulator